MGHFSYSFKRRRHVQLLLPLLLLLSSIQFRYSAQGGRPLVKLFEVDKEGEGQSMVMVGAMIGSRPPRCEGRCSSCGHCEAIQVPLVPQGRERRLVKDSSTTITSRGDDSSNYKPMNWKCKCGDMILNP